MLNDCMKRPLIDYLLSEQERALHKQHSVLIVLNFPIFLLANILLYFLATLLFINAIPWEWHFGLGMAWLLLIFIAFFLTKPILSHMYASPTNSVLWVLLFGLPITLWWMIYFTILGRARDAVLMQQLVMLLGMLIFIGIASIGRFSRITSLFLAVAVVYFLVYLFFWSVEGAKVIALQVLLMSLAHLIFLRTLNKQLSHLFQIKYENYDLLNALRQKNIALEQANQSQSRYLSAASHDLRQPLHALALLTNDVQRKNTVPEIDNTLKKMELAIDSLSQSFNAMLNLSRLDAGVVKPQFKRFPIQRLLQRLALEYADIAVEKNLHLTIRPSRLWVLSDEDMLHSILSNLLSNALRYTQRGGVLVGARPYNEHSFKIIVYDTGSGVPSAKAQQIFQEYQRLEEVEQRVKGGVGLGLAISERTAKLLGTKLWVKSNLGQGSAFGVVLTPTQPTNNLVNPPAVLQDVLTHRRVAIFDDDNVVLESLDALLSSWGMSVSIVLSSAMYMELVDEEGGFDFVISDYHLGLADETGLSILKTAAQQSVVNPPICILLTGDTRTELAQEVQASGLHLWYKPIRPARLRAYLNGLAQANQTQQ